MVRLLTFICLSVPAQYLCAQTWQAEQDSLQGTWCLVGQQIDGAANPDAFLKYDLTFADATVSFAYETKSGSVMKGDQKHRFTVNTETTPNQLNWFGERVLVQAIYALDGDELTIAYFGQPEIARPDDLNHAKTSRSIESPHILWKFRRHPAIP